MTVTSSTKTNDHGRRCLVIRIEGDVSLATIPRVTDSLQRELHASDTPLIVVDLDAVGTIDDAGLGVLLGFAARARSSTKTCVIVASSARIRQRLSGSRFDRAVDVFGSLIEAERAAR